MKNNKVPHKLFLALSAILLIGGILTQNTEVYQSAGWFREPVTVSGLWDFFGPTALIALITALIYFLFYKLKRNVSTALVFTHLILVVMALILVLGSYRFVRENANDFQTAFAGSNFVFAIPVLHILAIVIFAIALIKSKKQKPEAN